MWAQLFLEATGCLFWLAGFASLAAKVNKYAPLVKTVKSGVDALDAELSMCRSGCSALKAERDAINKYVNKWSTAAAGSGLGALMWYVVMP